MEKTTEFIENKIKELNNIVDELQEIGVYIFDDYKDNYLTSEFCYNGENCAEFQVCSVDSILIEED